MEPLIMKQDIFRQTLGIAAAALVAACGDGDSPNDESAAGGGSTASAARAESTDFSGCAGPLADVCSVLPKFTASEQLVDGIGDEFCSVPATTFAFDDLVQLYPVSVASSAAVAELRVGWSEDAFHAHIHVSDPVVRVVRASTLLWDGDSVAFFVAGTGTLTGFYGGGEDGGAGQYVVSPPDATAPKGRALIISEKNGLSEAPLDPATFAARLVHDGYEIELRLPWAASAEPRRSGAPIGFDLNVSDDGATGGTFAYEPPAVPIACPGSLNSQAPGCDDRTWCTPALE
jgi:cellulose/xylan binding protein with CBM9 domain